MKIHWHRCQDWRTLLLTLPAEGCSCSRWLGTDKTYKYHPYIHPCLHPYTRQINKYFWAWPISQLPVTNIHILKWWSREYLNCLQINVHFYGLDGLFTSRQRGQLSNGVKSAAVISSPARKSPNSSPARTRYLQFCLMLASKPSQIVWGETLSRVYFGFY